MLYQIMDLQERFTHLLADEIFQDEIMNLDDLSTDDRRLLVEKYSLTKRESFYAKRILKGLSFRNEVSGQLDINYALSRLKQNIGHHSSKTLFNPSGKLRLTDWAFRVASIFTIPLLITTLYFYQKASINTDFVSYSGKTDVINTFSAPLGAKTQVVLPDGSMVWLNSGSKLWCPQKFNSGSRDVKLVGEAYFEVVKNEKIPMIVSAGQLKINVYGTKFNLQAYEDDAKVETTLLEGKVTIISEKSTEEYEITPGYSASYNPGTGRISMNQVDNFDVYTGWKDGKLLFHNTSFGEIVKKLERWYGVDIRLKDPSLNKYILYATFYDENIEQILEIFSNSIPIKVEYQKRTKQPDGSYSKREISIDRDLNKKMK